MKLIHCPFILLLGLVGACSKVDRPPNVILILADDFGYMDMQQYAQKVLGTSPSEMYYETPHLNKLVENGTAFSRAYANQLCSPTRASILTGKYAAKLGFTTATPLRDTYYNQDMETPSGQFAHDVIYHFDNIDIEQAWINGSSNTALPAGAASDGGRDETTIAEALSNYHSAFIGKWHIGGHGAKGHQPADQGFNSIAWYDAGGSPYFNWKGAWNNSSKSRFPKMPQDKWNIGHSGGETGASYLTDDLTQQALEFLDQRSTQDEQPFFLYFCHFAVHSPWHAKPEDSSYFASKSSRGWNGHQDPRYAGMVRGLDNSVGAIMHKLEQSGLEDNTMVIFMSDNGGWDARYSTNGMATNNAPLLGGKACLTEGGIRVPLVFYWKNNIQGGNWIDKPVDCTDILPTIIEFASGDPSAMYEDIDGRSLVPLLNKQEEGVGTYAHNTRYWHYPFNVIVHSPFDGRYLTPRSAIMEDDKKLIFDWHGRLNLFDVVEDPYEEHNLIEEHPDLARDLFKRLISWLEENVAKQYWPQKNPSYNLDLEVRSNAPFVDLHQAYKSGKDIIELAN